jgi:hypothetical protein
MNNYTIDKSKKWDYENGFYLTCDTGRLGKFINHLELYKKILPLNGDILEFGVFKGNSISRLLSFRELLENSNDRKVVGFDAFGSFPNKIESKRDLDFAKYHDDVCGFGIDDEYLKKILEDKGLNNFELIKGDIIETLPDFLKSNTSLQISLLHIDVDIYEPTLLILELLWDKIVPGGILMLDDYDIIEGETIAVNEFFEGKDIFIHESKYHPSPTYIVKPKI